MGGDDSRVGRRLRVLLLAALGGLALGSATSVGPKPDRVKHLDVEVETPVYRLAPDLPVVLGEQHYRLHWSGFPVARVRVDMGRDASRRGLGVEIHGATHPVIDWIWRYRFEGRGWVATDPFSPGGFVVDECENRDHQRTEIHFDGGPDHGVKGVRLVDGRRKHYLFASDNTFDIPSSVYLVMNLDYATGADYALDTFTGKSRYLVRIHVEGREALPLGDAVHDTWRLRVETEELTDDDPEGRHRETRVWVSEHTPRRLLRASSRTFVGSIELELETRETDARESAASASAGRCT